MANVSAEQRAEWLEEARSLYKQEIQIGAEGWAARFRRLLRDFDEIEAERGRFKALVAALAQLRRYQEQDIVRLPSTTEYLNAEDVEAIVQTAVSHVDKP